MSEQKKKEIWNKIQYIYIYIYFFFFFDMSTQNIEYILALANSSNTK
jgi:hypothetical protein